MLQSVVIMVHIAVALLIIGVVLLQRGKGAEAGTYLRSATRPSFNTRWTALYPKDIPNLSHIHI